MPAACEWAGGCAKDGIPDGVPVFRLNKIDSDEMDGVYCRVHAMQRTSQMGKELLAARRATQEARDD
jgi:hypothetical protein